MTANSTLEQVAIATVTKALINILPYSQESSRNADDPGYVVWWDGIGHDEAAVAAPYMAREILRSIEVDLRMAVEQAHHDRCFDQVDCGICRSYVEHDKKFLDIKETLDKVGDILVAMSPTHHEQAQRDTALALIDKALA